MFLKMKYFYVFKPQIFFTIIIHPKCHHFSLPPPMSPIFPYPLLSQQPPNPITCIYSFTETFYFSQAFFSLTFQNVKMSNHIAIESRPWLLLIHLFPTPILPYQIQPHFTYIHMQTHSMMKCYPIFLISFKSLPKTFLTTVS